MANKLFSPDIPKKCEYCASCTPPGGERVCKRSGKPITDTPCRHYSYDPLRRVPHLPPALPVFPAENFKL